MPQLGCHIHVGMPKTGTSSIQSTFAKNPDSRFRYAPFPNANHSTLCAVCFEKRPEANRVNQLLGLSRADAIDRRRSMLRRLSNQMDKVVRNPNIQAVLLSGERLSNAVKANVETHQKMRDFFGRWCDDFKIYGYARPLGTLLASDFQQRIQTGHAVKIDLDFYYPNYRQKFEKFDQVYGRESVSIRRFHRGDLVGGDVVQDFAAQIGANVPEHAILRENQSLSLEGTAVLFTMARAGRIQDTDQATAEKNAKLVLALKRISGQKLAFCPDAVARVAEKNADDLKWTEARIGASLSDAKSKGTVIRQESELFEIAADVLKTKIQEAESSDEGTPRAEQIAGWLREDLEKVTAAQVH
jgi:hypothetical protein